MAVKSIAIGAFSDHVIKLTHCIKRRNHAIRPNALLGINHYREQYLDARYPDDDIRKGEYEKAKKD